MKAPLNTYTLYLLPRLFKSYAFRSDILPTAVAVHTYILLEIIPKVVVKWSEHHFRAVMEENIVQ